MARARLGHSMNLTNQELQQRKIAAWMEFATVVVRALLPVVVVNAVGAGLIGAIEKWTWIDVLYYGVSASTTIGYGDIHPDVSIDRRREGGWF